MNFKRKPYKIEVWEDKWIPATDSSPEEVKKRGGYWGEIKSVRLGDNESDFLGRAFNPLLTRDVTGEIKLSFSIYGYYYEQGKKVRNLLVPFLFNEAKIKLYYDEKWYDFIIKQMKESHDNKGLVYEVSCVYLPMSELSKNGWGINFSLEQENCIGTIDYFTNIILDGTDWVYEPDENCNLTEYALEYLYTVKTTRALSAYTLTDYINTESIRVVIPKGAYVYVPYSQINNDGEIQIIYAKNYEYENDYTLLKGTYNFRIKSSDLSFQTDENGDRIPELSPYYGYRIAQTAETIWEPELSVYSSKYVDIDAFENKIYYYGYPDTEIIINQDNMEATVNNIIRYYKKITVNGVEEIYKLKVLYGFGTPENQPDSVIGLPSLKQKYVDTSTEDFVTYVYNGTFWQLDPNINGFELPIGEEEIVYYNESDFNKLSTIYLEKNEKQRSLIDEKSNRFNLIQKLAELFEVWADFEILHEEDGRIKINPETGLPYKILTFKTEFGKDNYAGFSFDINLSGISRVVDSNALATKMYVEIVDNENSKDGICSIQTANNNLAKELFLINLDYYAQVGMIDKNKLLKDLYGTVSTDVGYLTKLGKLNTQYTAESQKRDDKGGLAIQISTSQEKVLFYTDALSAARSELLELEEKIKNGLTFSESINIDELLEKAHQTINDAENNLKTEKDKLEKLEAQLVQINNILEDIIAQKEELNELFYNMYSRFLQEGTWQGSDYIDPNAYYLDAEKVMLESSRPSIEYDIDVYDISQAIDYVNGDTYKLYDYDLGDITYVEDPDYFGYDSTGRPYREKVIVSTIENYLDSPQSNKILVKNYKTRFEDLFQRTTATVQSYNLNKNVYDRASAIEPNNSINRDTLQNALANNSFILSQSKTNSVLIDDSGIEVSNLNDYSQKVRIVAGGVFISNDGGLTWNAGITGNGINTKYLLAGQIDVEKINIMNGSFPTFAWDKYGLNAFSWAEDNETGLSYGYGANFVRYDQYGLYGVRNSKFGVETPFIPNHNYTIDGDGNITDDSISISGGETNLITGISNIIDNIRKYAQFSLTWSGFNLRTNNGSIEIDSEEDIRVLDKSNVARVKLGQLEENLYGLLLSDNTGKPTLQSNSDGNLSLTGKIYLGNAVNESSSAAVVIGDLGKEEIVNDYLDRDRRILVQKAPEEGGGNPVPTFVVYDTGEVYIAGGITAEYGDIGGFIIEEDRLYSNTVILSPNGISIKNADFVIYNENFEKSFYADKNGNIIANNITVNGGVFNNVQVNAEGSFKGTIEAKNGLINGSLILGNKNPIFKLTNAVVGSSVTEIIGTINVEESDSNLFVDNNNDRNNYYFVQFTLNQQEIISVFKLTYISVLETIEVILNLVYTSYNDFIETSFLQALYLNNPQFYRVANNNIVLDGQTGRIYTFDSVIDNKGYSLSGDGSIITKDITLGENSLIKVNDNGIEMKVIGADSIFSVDTNGTVTANAINITGESGKNTISGILYVGTNSNGIIINGTDESIYNKNYSDSFGSSGWKINNQGSAVFNDVTVRGRIESSTFIQGEVQALSGTLVIRPTLTFIDNSNISYQNGIYTGYVNEQPGILDSDYYQTSSNGVDYFFILRGKTEIPSLNGWEIKLERVGNTQEIPSNIYSSFVELPLINIGNAKQNTIGISLNATTNNTTFGFADSITIYDQGITESGDAQDFNFIRNNRLVMGRLPYEDELIPKDLQGSFGLYADNVYLNGAMVSATGIKGTDTYMTSGINTSEKNGNVFWAGAKGDTTEDIMKAPFRVTEDGYLYAKQGLFEGEINASTIRTARIIGRDKDASLRIMNYPDAEAYISFEQYSSTINDEDIYNVTAKLSGNSFRVGMPFRIYSNGQIDSTVVPALSSYSNNNNIIGMSGALFYNFYNKGENYYTSGWQIKNNNISFKDIQNTNEIDNIAVNYTERAVELINSSNFFEKANIGLNENYDSIDVSLDRQKKIIIESDNTKIYNNIIISDMTEDSVRCSLKLKTDFDENENKNIIVGYNLYIEEN